MSKLCIIGSSSIVTQHLKAARAVGFSLYGITSLNNNSKNTFKLKKRFKIKKIYKNWKKCIEENGKIKDMNFLIAPRIQDTIKVIKKVLIYKKPILVEKPISRNIKNFNNSILKSKKIFVGYNRIFYKTVNYLKKNLSSSSLISVNCPEKDKKKFIDNSCHIISILIYCFGNLRILKKYKKKNHIICILESKKKLLIHIKIVFNEPSNFSITLSSTKKKINLSPIEELTEYRDLIIKKKKNYNFYKSSPIKKIKDYNINFKPGFYNQYKEFKKFSKKNNKVINDALFARNVLRLTKKIVD